MESPRSLKAELELQRLKASLDQQQQQQQQQVRKESPRPPARKNASMVQGVRVGSRQAAGEAV